MLLQPYMRACIYFSFFRIFLSVCSAQHVPLSTVGSSRSEYFSNNSGLYHKEVIGDLSCSRCLSTLLTSTSWLPFVLLKNLWLLTASRTVKKYNRMWIEWRTGVLLIFWHSVFKNVMLFPFIDSGVTLDQDMTFKMFKPHCNDIIAYANRQLGFIFELSEVFWNPLCSKISVLLSNWFYPWIEL